MQIPKDNKKALIFLGIAAGSYALYRIFSKGDTALEAVKKTISVPVDAAEKVIKVVKKLPHLIKGSPEAKANMARLAGMRKSKGGRKKKIKAGDLIWTLKEAL